DRGADHREATRPHQSPASQACHSSTFSSCSAHVAANLVSPVSLLTLTKYSQSPSGGPTAASIAPPPGVAFGPGGSPVCPLMFYGLWVARYSSVAATPPVFTAA